MHVRVCSEGNEWQSIDDDVTRALCYTNVMRQSKKHPSLHHNPTLPIVLYQHPGRSNLCIFPCINQIYKYPTTCIVIVGRSVSFSSISFISKDGELLRTNYKNLQHMPAHLPDSCRTTLHSLTRYISQPLTTQPSSTNRTSLIYRLRSYCQHHSAQSRT